MEISVFAGTMPAVSGFVKTAVLGIWE